jgi:hypothetical protein
LELKRRGGSDNRPPGQAPGAQRIPVVFRAELADNNAMPQTTRQLEERLKRVEQDLAELKAAVAGKPRKPWYREIVGVFAGDEAFAEITRLGRLIRQGKIKG